jgi:hypothetical protein
MLTYADGSGSESPVDEAIIDFSPGIKYLDLQEDVRSSVKALLRLS